MEIIFYCGLTYLSDSRGGMIRIDFPDARIDGARPSLNRTQAVFLVEQEEDALFLRANRKLIAMWPTHGPESIRCLANYEEELRNRNVVVLYKNDLVGRAFAQTAARILTRFAKPRLMAVYKPLREWIRENSRDDIWWKLPRLLETEDIHLEPMPDVLTLTGTQVFSEYAGVWSEMDDDELFATLNALKLSFVFLDAPRMPFKYRVRLVPIRRYGETLSSYAQRTGYGALPGTQKFLPVPDTKLLKPTYTHH